MMSPTVIKSLDGISLVILYMISFYAVAIGLLDFSLNKSMDSWKNSAAVSSEFGVVGVLV